MKLRKTDDQADEAVYEMLLAPHIVSLTMHQKYGISNVPGAIFQARARGYAIHTKIETRGNKFGRRITIAKWSLKDKEAALKLYNKTK